MLAAGFRPFMFLFSYVAKQQYSYYTCIHLKLSRMDTHKQIKVAIKFYPIKIFFWGAFCFDFSLDFGLQCTLLVSPVYRDRLR